MNADSLRRRARALLSLLPRRAPAAGALEAAQQNLLALHASLSERLDMMDQRLASLEQQFADLHRHLHDWHGQLASLVQATMGKASLQELRSESDRLRERIAAIADALDAPAAPVASGAEAETDAEAGAQACVPPARASAAPGPSSRRTTVLAQSFYPALERHFRGTPEELRERMLVHGERLADLPEGRVADLGCGRGEWLALLRQWGIDAIGVDSNALNVAALREAGLDAVRDDVHAWLSRQPDASLAAITVFHLVEHLPFEVLLALLDDARRALAPGGLLLIETPDPENLLVATQSFWLDPTHRRPIPAALLEFAVSWSGFECEAVERLHPPEGNADEIADDTLRGLVHRGRDYALFARRPRSGGNA